MPHTLALPLISEGRQSATHREFQRRLVNKLQLRVEPKALAVYEAAEVLTNLSRSRAREGRWKAATRDAAVGKYRRPDGVI
jgi:hypothetical protein